MIQSADLFINEEARTADKSTIASGTPGETLMENAGRAVFSVIKEHFTPCQTLVLCGNGNNGGDGFVVARLLKEHGWPVALCFLGNTDETKSDAAIARSKWQKAGGKASAFSPALLAKQHLIVDAIFGTGLDREIQPPISDIITQVNKSPLPVVSIDIASGINGDSGTIMGVAMEAMHTVTFTHPKPGHFLLPGKVNTGQLHVLDIGISGKDVTPKHFLNIPSLWKGHMPRLSPDSHKYTRGHAVIMGGGMSTTGASKLASLSALRAGAGLVSVACSEDALPVYAISLTAVMTKPYTSAPQLDELLSDKRTSAFLIGPGFGVTDAARQITLQLLKHQKPCVIDADAISAFEGSAKTLFAAITGPTVLTPHEGEFGRLFQSKGAKPERAVAAARESNAVIVLKGNDTVIAAPDGRVAINYNAPVWLATAGSGDVLSGIITALLAQGMPAFEAACMGVWVHSETANAFGLGMIAEDLPAQIPSVLQKLYYE